MMNDEKDVVVILSGGLDSTTVLYKLLDEGKNPIANIIWRIGLHYSIVQITG